MRVKEAQDALQIAEKEHSIARIDFTEAQKDYERAKKLLTEGVASQSEFDRAERRFKGLEQHLQRTRLAVDASRKGLEIAKLGSQRMLGSVDDNEYMREVYQAEIERQQAQISILRSDLEKMVIRAPVSGPLLEKYVENRRVLMAGTPLLKLGDLASIEIECDVLSEEVVRVREGNEVEITGKALGANPVTGTVKRVYPSAFMKISSLGIEQQRVKTLIAFDNTALGLRAGTRIDIKIVTEAHDEALAVPERATFRREGQWYVFAVEGGRTRLRPVTLGLKNDEWAEVLEGLSPQEIIISEPMNDLEDGMRVEAKQ